MADEYDWDPYAIEEGAGDEPLALGWRGDDDQDIAPIIKKKHHSNKYEPIYASVAEMLCKRGATAADLAEAFKVHVATIYRWRALHDDFAEATKIGKEAVDDRVEQSLLNRALGYDRRTEKVFQYEGRVVRAPTIEHIPGDVKAQQFWLKNRRKQDWRESTEITGAGGQPLIPSDPVQLKEAARYYAFIIARANAVTVEQEEEEAR